MFLYIKTLTQPYYFFIDLAENVIHCEFKYEFTELELLTAFEKETPRKVVTT